MKKANFLAFLASKPELMCEAATTETIKANFLAFLASKPELMCEAATTETIKANFLAFLASEPKQCPKGRSIGRAAKTQ